MAQLTQEEVAIKVSVRAYRQGWDTALDQIWSHIAVMPKDVDIPQEIFDILHAVRKMPAGQKQTNNGNERQV